ncbi:hypothetical protein T03_12129 [Trichinella britovi]|uniref:Uncharacterized protein n=1 Tax=Trichinella britovi TaxID=45882 RepID=A0A0V1CIV2_TRIBR|nr:hypothetical protein T03_12129 [Trichinella britovi]
MQVLCSWFRLLFYKKEIMVCNDTGLIVRYIPFSSVTLTSACKQNVVRYSKERLRPRQRLRQFLKKFSPLGNAFGIFKKLFALLSLRLRRGLRLRLYFFKFRKFSNFRTICPRLRPRRRLRQFSKKILPLGHAFGNFQKNIYLVATPQAIFQKNICL